MKIFRVFAYLLVLALFISSILPAGNVQASGNKNVSALPKLEENDQEITTERFVLDNNVYDISSEEHGDVKTVVVKVGNEEEEIIYNEGTNQIWVNGKLLDYETTESLKLLGNVLEPESEVTPFNSNIWVHLGTTQATFNLIQANVAVVAGLLTALVSKNMKASIAVTVAAGILGSISTANFTLTFTNFKTKQKYRQPGGWVSYRDSLSFYKGYGTSSSNLLYRYTFQWAINF